MNKQSTLIKIDDIVLKSYNMYDEIYYYYSLNNNILYFIKYEESFRNNEIVKASLNKVDLTKQVLEVEKIEEFYVDILRESIE